MGNSEGFSWGHFFSATLSGSLDISSASSWYSGSTSQTGRIVVQPGCCLTPLHASLSHTSLLLLIGLEMSSLIWSKSLEGSTAQTRKCYFWFGLGWVGLVWWSKCNEVDGIRFLVRFLGQSSVSWWYWVPVRLPGWIPSMYFTQAQHDWIRSTGNLNCEARFVLGCQARTSKG